MDWIKLLRFIFFCLYFTYTVLFFAHVWTPPFWLLGTIFVLITLYQFVQMTENE